MALPSTERPAKPWQPARLRVDGVYRRERKPSARQRSDSNRRRSPAVSYDVRFQVDAWEFRYGFQRKGWADTFADKLHEHFAAGYLFDPQARRFITPEAEDAAGPTFAEYAAEHFRRKWPTWSPKTRKESQRELARACLHLVDADAPPLAVGQRLEADEYLRRAVLMVPTPAEGRETDRIGRLGSIAGPCRCGRWTTGTCTP